MEEVGRSINYPSIDEIIITNRRQIETTGGVYIGHDNIKERGSLEWVLDYIRYPLFDVVQCPTVSEKACYLTWTIIGGHVFWDANKRTGMTVLIQFLERNHFVLRATVDEIVTEALRIATSGETGYIKDTHLSWIRLHLALRPPTLRSARTQLDFLHEYYRVMYQLDLQE